MRPINILFINNDGAGFAEAVTVSSGTTIGEFFKQHFGDADESSYLIRVNREAVDRDHILHDGDRVSITPRKIEGAVSR